MKTSENSRDFYIFSLRNRLQKFRSTTHFCQFDKKSKFLFRFFCDRIRTTKFSFSIFPKKTYILSWFTLEKLSCFDRKFYGRRIEIFFLYDLSLIRNEWNTFIKRCKISLRNSTLRTSPILWNIRELCSW